VIRDACSGVTALRRVLVAAGLAACALGLQSPAARADGDPGSDVLVYQNLFVAADANMPVQQQIQLGNLLTAADKDGFPIRVAVVSQPNDLGAITALWQKPTAYASFLGTELSLAYAQRLLIVMPNGFGFNWQGHPAAAAYRVLDGLHIDAGGTGLATAAQNAVLALAHASGIRLTVPAGGTGPAGGAASGQAQGTRPVIEPATARAAGGAGPGGQVPLIAGVAVAVVLVFAGAAGGWFFVRWFFLRRGRPLPKPRLPRVQIPATWLAGGFVGLAVAATVVYAVIPHGSAASASAAQASAGQMNALTTNQNLDPGATLSVPAPDFTLTNQFGQPVSLSSFRGKVVILAFNDAECTTICPLTTVSLVDAKDMLGAAGSQVQLLGIDANPKATEIEDLLSYSQLHGMTYQWQYLTGSLAQLQSVWKAYSVGVTISQNQTDHEPAIFVIDQQGRLAKLYLTQMAYSAVGQLGQLLANEVSSLLPSHPRVNSHLSYAQISGISPATDTSLPAAGGGYVSVGPGQPGQPGQGDQGGPRLYLFFATWDQEITTLGGQLDALNAYQSLAGAGGLPPLTAIDEGGVEPSASALPGFLNTLRQPLSYPVGIDDSGQAADGYGVQGVPWFVLTSASGKVLWSREVSVSGWPSPAALANYVRSALASAEKSH
jgi:cytochrome oxidase Cu insertion factor (SCO1/SenC/PrrC family)